MSRTGIEASDGLPSQYDAIIERHLALLHEQIDIYCQMVAGARMERLRVDAWDGFIETIELFEEARRVAFVWFSELERERLAEKED